ncbi:Ltp family lipoprotein [Glutamicibacter sp.]|jgi:Membrane protein involved in colicin uptake|uniref:Ltp family lipoprotein n=1 Tax=Glutamicibacter sp. TaxID=1931995 RepID=UPI002B46A427|nr:Ltp family lipoprotein [Glutamicibacter sp.]HJX78320.1 Ltp family lipoprotein [Glutamicibacter sp.]
MSSRFNPPPAWRAYLPEDFVPAVDWIPERAWGAPPVGWPLWIESTTGEASEPPIQYQANPYLYMSVMPDWDAPETAQLNTPVMGSQHKPKKLPLSRGKKIGLGVVAGVLVIGVIGALGGGSEEQPVPVAASPSPSAVEANASSEPTAEPITISSASVEAEASAQKAADEQEKKAAAEASAKAEAEEKEKAEAEKKAKAEAEKKAKAEASAQAEAEAKAEKEAGTLSQQNALSKASDYLDYTAFSKTGLINQLEFEGFSNGDATWAVERVSVDWNEQAALKAADYLDYTSFSKSGLTDQLIYEGYTKKQAAYGVSTTGL